LHHTAADGRTWWDLICRVRRESLAKPEHHADTSTQARDSTQAEGDHPNVTINSADAHASRRLSQVGEKGSDAALRGRGASLLSVSKEPRGSANASSLDRSYAHTASTPRSTGERMYKEASQKDKERELWIRQQRAKQLAQELHGCTFSPKLSLS
jgi:hypothetical protein